MSVSSSVIRPYPYPYREHRHGLGHIISDIERSRHLRSREPHERFGRLYYRSPSIQRLHRMQQLRRRNETHRQSFAADNAARLSDDLLGVQQLHESHEETNTEATRLNADDSVLIVNEV